MKRQLAALVLVAALMPWPLLLTHGNWWAFILDTAAIIAILRLLLGPRWASYAGLRLSPVQALMVIAAFVLIAMGSGALLRHVNEMAGLKAHAPPIEGQIGFLFQAFNEEIFYRALMIGLLVQCIPSQVAISLGLAFIFAAAHFLLYRFSIRCMWRFRYPRSQHCSWPAWR